MAGLRNEYRRVHKDPLAEHNEFRVSVGLEPCPPAEFNTHSPLLNLYLFPEVVNYPRSVPLDTTWHRLQSTVRTSEEPFDVDEQVPGEGKAVYLSPASAAELPHWQRFLPGTTAWRISYGRRQVVEGVNAMLKGGFVNIQHKFLRVFGLAKMTLLLAFTLAGYNLEAIRSFLSKKEAERTAAPPKRTRKKRRTGTWTDVIGSDRPESGRSPPPG
ncbi:MAG: hypothetical protein WD206_01510 [Actinomycetota bacterium]